MPFTFSSIFTSSLPGESQKSSSPRQVYDAAYSFVSSACSPNPELCHINPEVCTLLGMNLSLLYKEANIKDLTAILAGNKVADGSRPYAMNYGGHQFGNWAGQLGDGRAINLGEITGNNQMWTIQLKGSGLTPYSRQGDGLAVLRSSVREHLCSEAMHHLGIPTTRSMALIKTGQSVIRDMMYDGNPKAEAGAIVARVSPSFIRFGSFELFASRGETATLTRLLDYCLKHHFTDIRETGSSAYANMFQSICNRTIQLIVHWQRVGFVHGVMNTDNMSILGLTIDYGPYGWLEGYDPNWTPNTTDRQQHRYAFGKQALVARWNLMQLANAIYTITQDAAPLEATLEAFADQYKSLYSTMMANKMGLNGLASDHCVAVQNTIASLEETLTIIETDYTIFFRLLSTLCKDDSVERAICKIEEAFYIPDLFIGDTKVKWLTWMSDYLSLININPLSDECRALEMNRVNPKYVLRNYMSQLAIDEAEQGTYTLLNELNELLKHPYDEQPGKEHWFAKRPEWAKHKVGCSMLSCSS